MREANGGASGAGLAAARPIAQLVCRVDIASSSLVSTSKVTNLSKVHVNRIQEAPLLAETDRQNQAAR